MINGMSYAVAALVGAAGGAGIGLGAYKVATENRSFEKFKEQHALLVGAAAGMALSMATLGLADFAGSKYDPKGATVLRALKELRQAIVDEEEVDKAGAKLQLETALRNLGA